MSLSNVIRDRRIVITVGTGGVGKTSTAAMLGLQAAVLGRKALVLTVDPAHRLADALGLQALECGQLQELSIERLHTASVPAQTPLTVAMLDTRRTWNELIDREVKDPVLAERIRTHPYFIRLTDLAGSFEYAAMEELYHLHTQGGYELLILDTPPATHGFDFLEAPDRLLDVLEHEDVRFLLRSAMLASNVGLRLFNFSGGYVIRTLARFTGLSFLRELAGFIDLFTGLFAGFRQRSAAVHAMLRSPRTAFVLVSAVDTCQIEETATLQRRLIRHGMNPQVLVANRVQRAPALLPAANDFLPKLKTTLMRKAGAGKKATDDFLRGCQKAHTWLSAIAARGQIQLEKLKAAINDCPLTIAPLLPQDIHDLAGLEQLRRAVFEIEKNDT
jgi:anion-transporting  ArsA/GET3 family ATPase